MNELILNESNGFDEHGYFPLTDISYNCENYLENILVKNFNYDNFYRELIDKFIFDFKNFTFLKNISSPIWLVNNVPYERKYRHLKKANLSNEAVNYFNKNGLLIFFTEPLNFYSRHPNYYNQVLALFNLFAKTNNLKNITVYTCERNVKVLNNYYKNLTIYSKNLILAIIALDIKNRCDLNLNYDIKKNKISKKFWCGNVVYSQHRHFMVNFLFSKSGNFSWKWKTTINRNKKLVYQKDINANTNFLDIIKEYNLEYYERILKNDKKILKKVPLVMDGKISSKHSSIIPFYDECFCAVVTETYYNTEFSDISEKTLQSIAYGKPFVLVAPPKSLEQLKDLGFKTFGDFWDESYDNEIDPQKRMLMIFDLIEHINSFTIEELKDLYDKMIPILQYNIEVLKTLQYNETIFE